jgi:thiosulfate/3-mercaptopyruvate sulfurtransferase
LWAARLWWELRAIGLDVQVLDGGLPAWAAAGLPVEAAGLPVEAAGLPVEAARPGQAGPPPAVERPGQREPGRAAGTGPGVAAAPGPRPAAAAWADRHDVLDALAARAEATVICALGEDAYSGRAATRYTRRGHIPGSGNLPARGLLDGDGLLLPPPALRAAVRPAVPADGGTLILYCGGGISAALLALGLTATGVTGISIYDGSLEEWTADPDLPVEVTP